jgi:hypothetical protein
MGIQATQNANWKIIGQAIVALRAIIKVLELEAHSGQQYRYDISADRTQARIYDATAAPGEKSSNWGQSSDNQVIAQTQKTLTEYAEQGKPIRLANIGLKDMKLALEKRAVDQGKPIKVIYSYNALTQEAGLTQKGQPILEIPVKNSPSTIPAPTSIAGWAKIGREVEKRYFESLTAAQEYGSTSAIETTRAEMIERGIIRVGNQS